MCSVVIVRLTILISLQPAEENSEHNVVSFSHYDCIHQIDWNASFYLPRIGLQIRKIIIAEIFARAQLRTEKLQLPNNNVILWRAWPIYALSLEH